MINPVIRLSVRKMSSNSFKEIQIPVPWGFIAGKEWGKPDGEPWIALHGWLDNCGSFDTLLPHFPENNRIIAVDIPGHGLSTHKPPGFSYHYLDGLQYIRRIANFYKLEKFSLVSHSMGAGMSMLYSVTHPEQVSRLVMLDAIKPVSRPIERIIASTRASVDDLLSIEQKLSSGKPTYYTYDVALKKLLDGSNLLHGRESISVESAKILLKRGLRKVSESEDQWEFTRDLKHRIGSLYGYPQEVIRALAAKVKCPHLIIKAIDGNLYEPEDNVREVLEIYKETNPLFKQVDVEGNHHVHLNNPEKVWPHIEQFIDATSVVSSI